MTPRTRWLWWTGAAVVVPAALAGAGMASAAQEVAAPQVTAPPVVAAPVVPPAPAAPTVSAQRQRLAGELAARPVRFDADSAALTPPGTALVTEIVTLLAVDPGVQVSVGGHAADTPGGADGGQALSEQRAQVVKDALVAAGIPAERITVQGFGAQRPLATVEESRRVEVGIG